MKRYLTIAVGAVFMFLVSCKNESSNALEGYTLYESDSLGLSLNYPSNFEAKEYFNQFIPISFFEKITDSVTDRYPENVLLNIEPIPIPVPFSDFMKASKTQLKIMIPEINIFGEDSTMIDGTKVGIYKFTRPKVDSNNFESKMFVFFQKERAISFSCTGMETQFDNYEPIFDKMMQTVQFKKNK